MRRSIQEINEKIKAGKAVVVTAEEMTEFVSKKGVEKAYQEVDVVTTGTFGPMCSSGIFLNVGHTKPRIKLGGGTCTLNGVPAYTGIAAVDIYLGGGQLPADDPRNKIHPGEFRYGGGHVIEEFVSGKDIVLEVFAYGTDCYPRKELKSWLNIKDVNEAVLFNIRNAYQNYNVAVNLSDRAIYTYLGILKPRLGNANYCSAGVLSPLLNDPLYRTIGIGTRIFLGGGVGFVAGQGTQHNPAVPRTEREVPKRGGGTLCVMGNLKGMDARYLRGVSLHGYGASLGVGLGIPIPILDEEMAFFTSVSDEDILAPIVDYSRAYPEGKPDILGEVSYGELRSGMITIAEKKVPTGSISSLSRAREIAQVLKSWIEKGDFLLTEPVERLPGKEAGITFKAFKERPVKQ
ncbi:MAG: homocysteine biosynthesis protein [Deltaproteobacteria bacterium]|nr:homocysteine biosynthesis protein [Deltaproteobacteria bacterium]